MTHPKNDSKPFTYSITYWNGVRAAPVSAMSEEEHKAAATLMVLRMANAYYNPKGYKIFSPEILEKMNVQGTTVQQF